MTFLSREDDAKIDPNEQKEQAVTSAECPSFRVLIFSPVAIDQRLIFPSVEHVARIFPPGSTVQYLTAPPCPSRRWSNRISNSGELLFLVDISLKGVNFSSEKADISRKKPQSDRLYYFNQTERANSLLGRVFKFVELFAFGGLFW